MTVLRTFFSGWATLAESIGEAAEVHGIDPDDLVDKINEFLAENAQ